MRIVVIILVLLIAIGAISFLVLFEKAAPVKLTETTLNLEKHEVIGTSVQERTIDAYTFGSGDKRLIFIGGIHGGYEWNTVILAYKVIDYLKANPSVIPSNLSVTVIPSANPDGVYKVIKKDLPAQAGGRFSVADVSKDTDILRSGRFNAHDVDLNRNFDCQWQSKSTWQSKVVDAGTKPFSEPEAEVLRKFILRVKPVAVVSWHSQSGFVYASDCEKGILPGTLAIMNAYSEGSGYPAVKTFDAYKTTGDLDSWLASINIPAITVELKTHESIEFDQNLSGIKSVFEHYSPGGI